ncbi:MAG: hypothetical protein COS15_03480 [Caldiserica bacterium CG02_land_8_20_14_3_00_36_38]|nr:MAG: hypothetical protein COS15_03480 [Caldiserica bacterium CG02_land_8_20_14_3_00_36_38]
MGSRNNIENGRDTRPQGTKLTTSIVPYIYFIRKIKILKIFSTIISYQDKNTTNTKEYGR